MYRLLACSMLFTFVASAAIVDPTAPYVNSGKVAQVADDSTPAIDVNAIINKNGIRMAMINGRLLKVGEQVSGNTLLAIDQFSVTFKNSEEQFTIRLFDVDLVKAE